MLALEKMPDTTTAPWLTRCLIAMDRSPLTEREAVCVQLKTLSEGVISDTGEWRKADLARWSWARHHRGRDHLMLAAAAELVEIVTRYRRT